MKKKTAILLAVAVLLVTNLCTGIFTYRRTSEAYRELFEEMSPTAKKTEEISLYLDEYFVDDYDEQALADAASDAMVAATGDKWSYYVSEAEYEDYQAMVDNAYVGIGVTISESQEEGGMRIESVTPDGPAYAAGIQTGDILTEVEGQATLELGMEGTRSLVKGEEGTTVHLTLRRGEQTLEMDVTRASIETEVACCEMLDGKIGYIIISNFNSNCADETIDCIEEMQKQGAEALIFDLRFNGGGYKTEMVEILDYLLPEGILFQSEDYSGKKETDRSDANCIDLPMAVLVNQESYSAAEFFAAAIQEYGAGTIVGSKTTGKGNFQNSFRLSDGSMLHISIGKYFTPNGVSLSETGVTPDVELDLSEEDLTSLYYGELAYEDDLQLQAAIQVLSGKIS